MNCKKKQYCKKASVKNGGFFMIFCPVVLFFPQLSFVNYLLPLVWGLWLCGCNCKLLAATCLRFLIVCGCHLNWTGRKNHATAGIIFFLTNTWIWLFFLKTGSIITQNQECLELNQQWLVHWVTLLYSKKSQHCWLTHIADQGKWIAKYPNIARKPV